MATQDREARLRRLEQAIDENHFRATFADIVSEARDEVKLLSRKPTGMELPLLLHPRSARGNQQELPLHDFSQIEGLGALDCPGFPVDECPEGLPDLSLHRSHAAVVLRTDPSVYRRLALLRTQGGVSLARCIKPCLDVPEASSSGLVAGDVECYKIFAPLFEPVIRELHPTALPSTTQPFDMDHEALSGTIDPTGACAKRVTVEMRRNIVGHHLAPALSRVQRRVLEQRLTQALEVAVGGGYFPLQGSQSFPSRRGGMSDDEASELEEEGMLFGPPETRVERSAGFGRNWPDGRGVWASEERDIFAWLGTEDHVRLHSLGYHSGDLVGAFRRACQAERALAEALQKADLPFARYKRLGFVTARPENLGTALRVEAVLSLPQLGAHPELLELCDRLKLRLQKKDEEGPHSWVVSNVETLGSSELEQASAVAVGVRALAELESKLARGGQLHEEMARLPGQCC